MLTIMNFKFYTFYSCCADREGRRLCQESIGQEIEEIKDLDCEEAAKQFLSY